MIGSIGLVAFAFNSEINGYLALPYLIKEILPIGFKSLAASGMLAVVMSTADSYLNIASISIVHDVINPLRKVPLSDIEKLRTARIGTFIIGILTMVVALMFRGVLDLVVSSLYFWWFHYPHKSEPCALGISFQGIYGAYNAITDVSDSMVVYSIVVKGDPKLIGTSVSAIFPKEAARRSRSLSLCLFMPF